mgnify:CR=1 FL=1
MILFLIVLNGFWKVMPSEKRKFEDIISNELDGTNYEDLDDLGYADLSDLGYDGFGNWE